MSHVSTTDEADPAPTAGGGAAPGAAERDQDVTALRRHRPRRARLRPLSAASVGEPGSTSPPAAHGADPTTPAAGQTLAAVAATGSASAAGSRDPAGGPLDVLARLLVDPRRWVRLRLGTDVAVLCVTVLVALLEGYGVGAVSADRWVVIAGFMVAVLVAMHARSAPDDRLSASSLETFGNVLGVSSLAAMIAIVIDSALHAGSPLSLTIRLWLFSVVYLGIARVLLMTSRRHAMRAGGLATPTLIVGAGIVGAKLADRLGEQPAHGLRPVGYLDANPLPHAGSPGEPGLPVLGTPEDLEEAIALTGARHVILSFSSGPDHLLVATVRRCQQLRVGVSLVPRLYESINARSTLDHVGGIPLLTLRPLDPKGWQFALKHTLDRSIACLGLIAISPVMCLIAVAVRLTSPGPVLFRQRRVGRDGQEFDVLKFRTMSGPPPSADDFDLPIGIAPGGVEGEDRRTPLGRWLRDLSLDELPQLINVLRGDMSLVGPRPERPDYVVRFSRDVARYEDRHRVKSGITGWAQVHGLRGQTSIADRVEWDNYYILNWSVRLDLRILGLTVVEILRRRG